MYTQTSTTDIWSSFSTNSGRIVTSMPPGWSTEILEDKGITANTRFNTTTTEDGKSQDIILPVIWCSDCGGAAKAVLIKIPKFPSWIDIETGVLPKISFSLPGIPSFNLPCIPIPVLHPCSSPPGKGEESKDDDEPGDDDEPDDEDPPDDGPLPWEPTNIPDVPKSKPSDEESQSSSSEQSTSTSSFTESCSSGTATAQSCEETCLDYSTTSGTTTVSTQKCYTTTCVTTTGCSVEGTTITSTTTSSAEACQMQTPQMYDIAATYSMAGLPFPDWTLNPAGIGAMDEYDWSTDPENEDSENGNPEIEGSENGDEGEDTDSSTFASSTTTSAIITSSPSTPSSASATTTSGSLSTSNPTSMGSNNPADQILSMLTFLSSVSTAQPKGPLFTYSPTSTSSNNPADQIMSMLTLLSSFSAAQPKASPTAPSSVGSLMTLDKHFPDTTSFSAAPPKPSPKAQSCKFEGIDCMVYVDDQANSARCVMNQQHCTTAEIPPTSSPQPTPEPTSTHSTVYCHELDFANCQNLGLGVQNMGEACHRITSECPDGLFHFSTD